jgi:hypothetical protein
MPKRSHTEQEDAPLGKATVSALPPGRPQAGGDRARGGDRPDGPAPNRTAAPQRRDAGAMGSGGDRRAELKAALQHLNRQFAR